MIFERKMKPRSKKICMITLRHAALDCRVFYKEAITLRNAGYEVHYINRLSDEGYFTDMGSRGVGKPDQGGEWSYEGIVFHGIQKQPKTLRGKYREVREIVQVGLKIKADAYHCHETDIALAAAIRIKKKMGAATKFIFDSHEYWAGVWAYQFAGKRWRFILPVCKKIEKILLSSTDAIIASDLPTFGALIQYDLRKKAILLYNVPSLSHFDSSEIERSSGEENSKTILVHEGSLSNDTGIDRVLDFLEKDSSSCVLEILGKIIPSNEEEKLGIEKLNNEKKIKIRGWVDYPDVGKMLTGPHIALSLRENSPNHITAAPNKLFNYMYAGLPIIADNFPGMADIIQKYQCGILIQPDNVLALKQAIEYLIEHPGDANEMGKRGYDAVHSEMNWEAHGQRLLDLYDELFRPKLFKICNNNYS